MDPALQELFAEGSADDEVAVILRLAGDGARPDGVRIIAQFGEIVTCRLQRGDIQRVRAAQAVHSMKAARLYGPSPSLDDREPEDSDADANADGKGGHSTLEPMAGDVRRPDGAMPSGRGVVVAHIDWGVDFAHPDFRDQHGRTRLIGLWDQSCPADPAHPNRYGFGRIYNAADIDAALATPDPYKTLRYHPGDSDTGGGSHGTHTLSIAAGNGGASGPVGVAPDAQLVFVHLSTYTDDGPAQLGDSVALLEAFDFIASTAAGRPLVVNASIGRHAGEHDGRTLVEQGMDAFLQAAPGRAIVLSTGNYFHRHIHTQGLLRPGEERTLTLVADAARRTAVEVDLWYAGVDRFGIVLRGANGGPDTRVAAGAHAPVVVDGHTVGRLYHRLRDPNNGDNQVTLFLYRNAPPRQWELCLIGDDVADGRFHAWVERDGTSATSQAQFARTDADPRGTTGTICNGLRTLAVGAYDAHQDTRPLARFSSAGPTRDGRQKPDLVAPGVRVLAARSLPRHGDQPRPRLTRMSGTSMAAPHVTGAVALMFEAAGRPLGIDETRRLLLENCETVPEHASPLDHLRFGNGFLDMQAAVTAARRIGPAPQIQTISSAPAAAPNQPDKQVAARSVEMDPFNQEDANQEGVDQEGVNQEGADMDASEASGDNSEKRRERARRSMNRASAPLPFQVQLPIGGGAPALAVPVGGRNSPFALSVPLGPTAPAPAAAPAPVAAATTAPAPPPVAAAAPQAAAEPLPAAAPLAGMEPITIPGLDVPLYVAPAPEAAFDLGETAPPGARPMLQRGSRNASVLEAQNKLNTIHTRRVRSTGSGLAACPLAPDGVFGNNTYQAVLSFQRLAFPGQPSEWDGVVGPKTWQALDLMSAAPIPIPTPTPIPIPIPIPGPDDFPPVIPVSAAGCGNLVIWLSAFIPRSVSGYTFVVPAGPHAGQTAVPCPLIATPVNPRCYQKGYLTDQRGFVASPTASSRMRSLVEIQLLPPRMIGVGRHETSGTTEIHKDTGAVTCAQPADMTRCSFSGFRARPEMFRPGDFRIELHLDGKAGDPCVNLAADIDYVGDIEVRCSISRGTVEVTFNGRLDDFPAYEMYASLGGVTKTLFRVPPPAGNTVASLLGMASNPVSGRVEFECTFASEQPPGGTALAARRFAQAEFEAEMQAEQDEGEFATYEAEPLPEQPVSRGLRLLEMAEAFAQSPTAGPASAAALIEALLEASADESSHDEQAGEAADYMLLTRERPATLSPTALYNAFVHHDHALRPRSAQQRQFARSFELLARPGDRLSSLKPRPGDLLVRVARGEGWGQVAVVASPGLHRHDRLTAMGLRPEGRGQPAPGSYLHVVEILPVPKTTSAQFARRLADDSSAVLGDTVLLRPVGADEGGAQGKAGCGCHGGGAAAAESEAPGQTQRPLLLPVERKLFRMTAKSFINVIGSHTGSLACGPTVFGRYINSPLTGPGLSAFAAATDLAYSEDPVSDAVYVAPPPINKGYRLFSTVRIEVAHRGTELVSVAAPGGLVTDVGREGPFVPPPLIVDTPFSTARIDASRMRVSWAVRGRPAPRVEISFTAICDRTSVFIWHRVSAIVDCSSGTPVMSSPRLEGSRFPSHRLWINGAVAGNLVQGDLSNLWDATSGDPTRVR